MMAEEEERSIGSAPSTFSRGGEAPKPETVEVIRISKRDFTQAMLAKGHWLGDAMGDSIEFIMNAIANIVGGSGKGAVFVVTDGNDVKVWYRDGASDCRGEPATKPIGAATVPGRNTITELDYYSSGEP